jgi:hypothetical protein
MSVGPSRFTVSPVRQLNPLNFFAVALYSHQYDLQKTTFRASAAVLVQFGSYIGGFAGDQDG